MSVREITMFHVVCDNCGRDAQDGSEYIAWAERDTARIEPNEAGWLTDAVRDVDLCGDCHRDPDDFRPQTVAARIASLGSSGYVRVGCESETDTYRRQLAARGYPIIMDGDL